MTSTTENKIRIFIFTKLERCFSYKYPGIIYDIDISKNMLYMVVSGEDKDIHLLNSNTGEVLNLIKGHTELIRSTKFSPIEDAVCSISDDKTAKFHLLRKGKEITPLTCDFYDTPMCI